MPLLLITGAGRRLGRALAIEFAKKGYDISIVYNRSQIGANNTLEIIKSLNQKAICIKADIRNIVEINNAIDLTMKNIGIPDVLINNSGVLPDRCPIDSIDENLWDNTININLRAAFFFSKKFAKYAQTNSRIINIGSLGGREIWKQRIPYNVSKAALIHLTKALARELAPKISVNCVAPGSVIMPDEASETDKSLQPIERIPMGRYANINDIFDACYFFANATNYITGQILTVDGGNHLVK